MAASIAALPVPETGIVHSLSVWNAYRSSSWVSSMMSTNDGSRWPTSGVLIALSTRGWTGLGPGPISVRCGGFSSPTSGASVMATHASGASKKVRDAGVVGGVT